MLLATRNFGEIEVDQGSLIRFEDGIPGFENVKEFTIIDNPEAESPFKWLQSFDAPELAFVVVNPFDIKKDYDFELSADAVKELNVESEQDVLVFTIVVVPEDISKMTMNLKAPVIINTKNNKGAQIVLDTDKYSVRHYILDEIRRQEVAGDAGANKKEGSVDHNK